MEKKRGGRGHDGWTLSETPTRVSLQRGRDQKKKKKERRRLNCSLYTRVPHGFLSSVGRENFILILPSGHILRGRLQFPFYTPRRVKMKLDRGPTRTWSVGEVFKNI